MTRTIIRARRLIDANLPQGLTYYAIKKKLYDGLQSGLSRAMRFQTHPGSEISSQQPPITNLEHPSAIIATEYCKRMFPIGDWRWLTGDFLSQHASSLLCISFW